MGGTPATAGGTDRNHIEPDALFTEYGSDRCSTHVGVGYRMRACRVPICGPLWERLCGRCRTDPNGQPRQMQKG